MLEGIQEIAAAAFLAVGLLFMFIGAVGVVRLPDAYNRLHASSKCATLGLMGMLLGAVLHMGTVDVAAKAALTMLFMFVANPVGSHILAKAAHLSGLKQWKGTLSDELADDRNRQAAADEDPTLEDPRFNVDLPDADDNCPRECDAGTKSSV